MKQMITLYADEGKILKDGDTFGTTMQLADGKTADGIIEITMEEYEKITETEVETK
jgi:hypothetical protein